jgi:hypothetical protein
MKFVAMDWTGVAIHDGTDLDYPTAWAIQKEVSPALDHDPRCSSVPGWHKLSGPGLLCDCGAVEREWERRNAALGMDALVACDVVPHATKPAENDQ